MHKTSAMVSESGTAEVGNSYKTSNPPDLYSGSPPIVKNYPNNGYIKDKAGVRSNCETSDHPDVYRGAPSKAIVSDKRGDVSNLSDVHKGTPEENLPPKNKVGSSFMKIIPAKKHINTFNRCNKNNI